ncbi:DNA oxidative demethylase ALKBH2 isoform X1 [Lingula anatina]|uniref:DNA oxidative demethylase ALKBH2 n=1 Tax=Lingula anatina TaxID=7574 RepID=A0A1S3HDN7_LINAN|nr:DNA oxidative demethylase ALKBH2 isoform X1 [Lingula anatina]|eukprot:XP_013383204.1 DNA oxidative demethylase ALKBH2 isoform X1 [Lingula anatina]
MDNFVHKRKRSTEDQESIGKKRNSMSSGGTLENGTAKNPTRSLNIKAENLDLEYHILFSKREADDLFQRCEKELIYNTGQLAQVKIFGKWLDIPRKQVAHGDEGLAYTFSNNTIPAKPWTPLLLEIKDAITHLTGHTFNFVLINRYKDGRDYMGEHKDDEKDLDPYAPIASLSLGQQRDFVFKHGESRGKGAKRKIDPVKVELASGSLLLMKYPTNRYWYHCLPVRRNAPNVRINMTFRQMLTSEIKGS